MESPENQHTALPMPNLTLPKPTSALSQYQKKSPLQKLPSLSELYLNRTKRKKEPIAGGEEAEMDPQTILSNKPSPLKRQNTHGGEHNPNWRTHEPLIPSERLLTSSEDSGEEDSTDLYNSLESDVDLNVGLDHARYLIAAHKRLKYLRLKDFILPSHIVIAPKVRGDIESEVLGEGAQGTIFRAFIKGSGSTVFAVKCGDSKSILQEFSLCRHFEHENIVKGIGFSVALDCRNTNGDNDSDTESTRGSGPSTAPPRWIYMAVYEYCSNGDLLSYLSKNPKKRKDLRFLQSTFIGVARGLEHIHEKGFAHCDIKPDNILLDANGNCKIADFGLCQPFSSRMIPQGTPSYIAPEVLNAWFSPKDRHRFSDRIDIFSLGAMAVKIVTDRYPFPRTTARMSRKERFTSEELRNHFFLSDSKYAALEAVSPKFARLVLLCLANEAIDRPGAKPLLDLIFS